MTKSHRIIEFTDELVMETSYSSTPLGKNKCSMEFFEHDDKKTASIEWVYGIGTDNEDAVEIGLWFDEKKRLEDYDGVFELNKHAIKLIRQCGYHVPKDFES